MFADQKFSKSAMLAFRDVARAKSKEEYDSTIRLIKDRITLFDSRASDLLDQSIDAHEKANEMEEEIANLRSEADHLLEESNYYQEKGEEWRNLLKFIDLACKPRF